MRWPVSAGAFDAVVTLLTAERAAAQVAAARYDALLDKYHALRLVGGVSPQPVAERRDDPVSQAIIAKARGNPALYAHYASYVATQRAMRIPEDSIVQSILRGVDDDLGVPL